MFSFNRRINGKTYYARIIISFIPVLGIGFMGDLVQDDESTLSFVIGSTLLLAIFVWLIFTLSQIRQRANDIGKHPLLITALVVWSPLFLLLGLIPGQKQSNRYGPPPGRANLN